MRGYNRYFKDHLKDELQSIQGLGLVLFDVNRFIRLDELSLPVRPEKYTMRQLLEVEEKLRAGEIIEEVVINESKMIVEGELIYMAAKRLRRVKISYRFIFQDGNNTSGFSIINNPN